MPFTRLFRSRRSRTDGASISPNDAFLEEPGSHFPQSFDAEFYRSRLAGVGPEVDLRLHFENEGRAAGLPGSPGCSRKWIIGRLQELGASSLLEIGPGCNPMISGDGVFYFDVKNREQLLKRYAGTEAVAGVPPEIHFVDPEGDLTSVGRSFSVVVSSHVIEHTRDLIAHLEAVESLLFDGGYYVLIVPDQRYCFDHFKSPTELEEVIAQHAVGDAGWSRFLYCFLLEKMRRTHNTAARHWEGDHGTSNPATTPFSALADIARAAFRNPVERYGYHNWFFSDRSFEQILAQLCTLNLISLQPCAVYNTLRGSFEFCAVLRKPPRAARKV